MLKCNKIQQQYQEFEKTKSWKALTKAKWQSGLPIIFLAYVDGPAIDTRIFGSRTKSVTSIIPPSLCCPRNLYSKLSFP